MTAPTHRCTIASIDVSAYLIPDCTVTDSFTSEINSASLTARYDINDAVTLTSGQNVKIWRSYTGSYTNDEIIFDGKIKLFEENNLKYTITCNDQLDAANTTVVNYTYLNSGSTSGKFSEIFKDIINTYVGLTADGTSVQDSGVANVLIKFICRNAYALERIKKMETALNWRAYYDCKTAKCNFEPLKFTTNTNVIGVANLADKPEWSEDQTEMANVITAVGATVQTQRQESFAGPVTQITLLKKPESIAITVGGTLKKGGQQGDTSVDYWVDKENKQVNFNASSSTIVATYFFASPIPLTKTNPASVAVYGSNEMVVTLTDVTSVDDLMARLSTLLDLYSLPFTICKCPVKFNVDYGYEVGQNVAILDPFTGQSATLPIQKITRNLFGVADQLQFGNKEFRLENYLSYGLDSRIKKLEEESTQDTDITYTAISLAHTGILSRQSMTMEKWRINDTFIAGHAVNGVLGRGQILDDFETSSTVNWSGTNCAISEQLDV